MGVRKGVTDGRHVVTGVRTRISQRVIAAHGRGGDSTYEGVGLPYLEAMSAARRPRHAESGPARPRVRGGVFGLVEIRRLRAFMKLLADEGRRRALEIAGIRRAAEFSIDRMIDQYETLSSELRGSHARSIVSA